MTSDVSLRPAVAEDREFLDRWFRLECTFIIRLGDEGVGVIAFEDRGDELYIRSIEAHPDHQNHGVGTAVMLRIPEQATEAGKAVTLHVFVINLAQNLYRRPGFNAMSEGDGRLFMTAPAARFAGVGLPGFVPGTSSSSGMFRGSSGS